MVEEDERVEVLRDGYRIRVRLEQVVAHRHRLREPCGRLRFRSGASEVEDEPRDAGRVAGPFQAAWPGGGYELFAGRLPHRDGVVAALVQGETEYDQLTPVSVGEAGAQRNSSRQAQVLLP